MICEMAAKMNFPTEAHQIFLMAQSQRRHSNTLNLLTK